MWSVSWPYSCTQRLVRHHRDKLPSSLSVLLNARDIVRSRVLHAVLHVQINVRQHHDIRTQHHIFAVLRYRDNYKASNKSSSPHFHSKPWPRLIHYQRRHGILVTFPAINLPVHQSLLKYLPISLGYNKKVSSHYWFKHLSSKNNLEKNVTGSTGVAACGGLVSFSTIILLYSQWETWFLWIYWNLIFILVILFFKIVKNSKISGLFVPMEAVPPLFVRSRVIVKNCQFSRSIHFHLFACQKFKVILF